MVVGHVRVCELSIVVVEHLIVNELVLVIRIFLVMGVGVRVVVEICRRDRSGLVHRRQTHIALVMVQMTPVLLSA